MTRHTIFQKAICNLAVITFVCSLLVFCPVHASAEALPAEAEPADLALERLNKYAETVMEQRNTPSDIPATWIST